MRRPVSWTGFFSKPWPIMQQSNRGRCEPLHITCSLEQAAGKITSRDYNVYAAGDRAAEVLYDIPNATVRTSMSRGTPGGKLHPFAIGRAVARARCGDERLRA